MSNLATTLVHAMLQRTLKNYVLSTLFFQILNSGPNQPIFKKIFKVRCHNAIFLERTNTVLLPVCKIHSVTIMWQLQLHVTVLHLQRVACVQYFCNVLLHTCCSKRQCSFVWIQYCFGQCSSSMYYTSTSI